MTFIIILIFSALAISATGAYFSILGLASIFSGAFWPVVIMGSVLEAGKLVAASYVYRFKTTISKTMKIYLVSAIFVLMVITSLGIFGFLSKSYTTSTLPLEQQKQQIQLLISEQAELKQFKQERLSRKKQIDSDITDLPSNFVTGRQRLLKSYKPEIDQLKQDISLYTKQISKITLEISKIKQEKLISEVHTGPIIFIAKIFSAETDSAIKWMIILLIFAFDPLALSLVVAANHALLERKRQYNNINNSPVETSTEDESIIDFSSTKVEELQTIITKLQNKDLTALELTEKSILEEILAKKLVTEKIRNPNKVLDK